MENVRVKEEEGQPTMPAAGLAGIPYQDPNFRNAVQLAIASSGKIANVYKTVSRKPSEDTRKEADAMAKYPIVEERNIGMAGISGAGKSSLICSLLQDAGIAIRDGGGRAMTCFPVHYRYKLAEHTAKYNLRCVFPDGKAFAERIAKLQEDLNAPYHIEKNELPPTEYEILEKDAGAAEATLTALFGKMDGFSLERLIWGDGRTTKEKTKPCLLNWATKLKLPDGTKEGIWSSEEKCTKDLQKALQKFQLNGLWPLIESLSIYLDAPLLKNGVVLIDLPGSHDTNMARVKIAEETQAKCDDIFMVAPIGRAVDSPVLQKFVEDNMSRPDFGSLPTQTVTAVFTNAATIDATIYKYADQDALQAANDALAILEADDDASAKKVRQVEHQIKSLIMQGRNQHVIADATSAYGSKLDKGCFHVFCVDNTMFMERKTQEAAELSGIPKLQEHVASLPAKTLFKLHNSFISTRLDATLASFETWVASCRPRPGKTQSVLPTPDLNGYVEQLRGWDATISGVFESCVKSPILEADMQKSIREETSEVALEWRKIHYGYFAALCRREGIGIDAVITPKSRRGGKAAPESDNAVKKSTKINNMSPATTRNLNKELCQCFGESTKECWLQLDAEVKSSLEDLDAEISLPFETYLETCKKLGAPKPILRSLTARTENLSDVLTAIRKRFLSGLSVIKNDVVRGSTTSYVRQYMLAAYDEAIGQRGKGVSIKRHTIIEEHVDSPDLVKEVVNGMWADFQKQKTARIDEMKDAIGAASKAIEADIDIYQGKRDAIPLFKLYPNVGKEVEAVLEEVKAMRAEVDKLAEPARQRAKEMYGEEFLAPPRVGGSKEKKEKNKSHPTVEPKSRRARAKKVKVEEEENDEGEVEDSESEQADDAENEEREDCESEEEDEDQEEEDDEDEEDEEQSDMEDDD